MYIAIFGRQPSISLAELERVFGSNSLSVLSDYATQIDSTDFNITNLGSIPKAGKMTAEIRTTKWPEICQYIASTYYAKWSSFEGKITLGISTYGFNVDAREVQKVGIILKQKLKKANVSLRLIPNTEIALNTATSHHNKLGLSDNKVELLVIRANNGRTIVAESTGAQNITAYSKRDQKRPKRDAFVGMLPPKLAQIMINLAIGQTKLVDNNPAVLSGPLQPEADKAPRFMSDPARSRSDEIAGLLSPAQSGRKSEPLVILDPFCGTGVILQEAALMGYSVYGTDISEKMIEYSHENLQWLAETHGINFDKKMSIGNAMDLKWYPPIDAVVSETYLGQPFSAPPSPSKLVEVTNNCNHIVSEFLINLRPQINSGTPVCLAVPAWRNKDGDFTHLPFVSTIAHLGYKPHEFRNVSEHDMIYYREDQVVARELLVLTRV